MVEDDATDWMAEARMRVADNPALEVMAERRFHFPYPPDQVWSVIATVAHWGADAFHNEITEIHGESGPGARFGMRHTNSPIIPWPMADQRFMGVMTDWVDGERQSVSELNLSDAAGPRRTPDHQQTIALAADGAGATAVTYTVATIRIAGLNPVIRFFFRPWARLQLRRAIEKKRRHMEADLAARHGAKA